MARRQDAPGHRDEVGEEVDRTDPGVGGRIEALAAGDPGELLLDLGDVAVAPDAVRLHALVDLAEHEVRLRLATRSRHATLGIDHEIADEARTRERGEGQERRRRVAARRPDDRHGRVDERFELGPVESGSP
jgi:hypothetical protein